eukprot:COSAG02_NODE_1370_length_13018_cov_50.973218_2_plen_39_part_00
MWAMAMVLFLLQTLGGAQQEEEPLPVGFCERPEHRYLA